MIKKKNTFCKLLPDEYKSFLLLISYDEHVKGKVLVGIVVERDLKNCICIHGRDWSKRVETLIDGAAKAVRTFSCDAGIR